MRRRAYREARHHAAYVGLLALSFLGRTLPRWLGLALFGAAGRVLFMVPTPDRERAARNLEREIKGRPGGVTGKATAARVYREFGRNLFDALYLSRCSARAFDRIVEHDSLDEFRKAYGSGRGVIVITAHLGCYEMLLHFFARKGFESFAIGRRAFDSRVEKLINRLRSGPNIEYLDRTGSARRILRLLAQGKAMGVLVDQDTKGVDGVFAHFLGRLAYTPAAPLKIAVRHGVPAFVVLTARQANGRHRVWIEGPLKLENTGQPKRDLLTNVERVNARIGDAVLRYPEQWVWMHPRWRHKPGRKGFEHVPNVEEIA